MNELRENVGWIILALSILIGCTILYYTPRTVETSLSDKRQSSSPSEQNSIELPSMVERLPSFEQYLPGEEQDPFRPPRRWRSVSPETPVQPPLPELQLPDPVFVLPTPPSEGPYWSTIHSQLRSTNATVTLNTNQFRSLAEQVKSPSPDQSSEESIEDKFRTFDRLYLKDEEKWLKGTITDKSEYFLTFRNHKTGKSRQFSIDNVKTEPDQKPVASLREEMNNEKPISNLDKLNRLIDRARNLGMLEDAASLLESYINNQLPNLSLYRRAATLYTHAGKPEQALRLLNQAVDRQTVDTHELLFLTAQTQWDMGLQQRAIETLQRSIDKHPLFIEARLQQFLYLMKLDAPSRAAKKLDKLRMETSGIAESKPKRQLYQFARIYHLWSYQDRTKARQFIEQLPTPSDVDDSFSFAWAQALAFRSRLHLEKGQLKRALSVLREGLEQKPASYALWNNLGVLALSLENRSLAQLCFSVCERLAPYRVQHRLATSHLSTSNGNSGQGAVRTSDNLMPIAYHYALKNLQTQKETSGSQTGNVNQNAPEEQIEDGETRSGSTPSQKNTSASGSPANPGTSPSNNDSSSEDDQTATGQTEDASSSFAPRAQRTKETPTDHQQSEPAKSDETTTAARKQSIPSPLEGFRTVYDQNTSFIPGAIGLGYLLVKNGNTSTGRSLLFQYGPEHWLSQYVIARSYIQDDKNERALDYLNEVVTTPENPTDAAYFKIIKAYLMLENGRTRQAGVTLDSISDAPEALSEYKAKLTSIVENSQQMRELTDSFDRLGDAGSISGDWERNTQNAGISILQKSGYVSFEGTLGSAYPFPRIERPTNEKFVFAEFSVDIIEQTENLFIGVALLNSGSENTTGPIAVGVTPLTPTPKLYTTSGALSHLNTWNERSWPMKADQRMDPDELTIRLGRSDTSSDAKWYASLSGQKVNFDQPAPDLPDDNSNLSVALFVSGPNGTPIDLQLKQFRLVHEFSK